MKKLVLFILLSVLIISCSERKVTFKCKTDSDIFKHGYYNIIVKRKELDKSTFMCLDGGYAKDRNNVYVFPDYKIEEANPTTFEVLSLMYAKDKKQIYFNKDKLPASDLKTFKAYDADKIDSENGFAYDAEDKNNYYRAGKLIKVKWRKIKKV